MAKLFKARLMIVCPFVKYYNYAVLKHMHQDSFVSTVIHTQQSGYEVTFTKLAMVTIISTWLQIFEEGLLMHMLGNGVVIISNCITSIKKYPRMILSVYPFWSLLFEYLFLVVRQWIDYGGDIRSTTSSHLWQNYAIVPGFFRRDGRYLLYRMKGRHLFMIKYIKNPVFLFIV